MLVCRLTLRKARTSSGDLQRLFHPPDPGGDARIVAEVEPAFMSNTCVGDKRHISEGIDELIWLAALKPTTVGVPEYRDETREYLEIVIRGLQS